MRLVMSVFVLLVMACNNAAEQPAAETKADSVSTTPDHTDLKNAQDSLPAADPLAITDAELKDDSVFTDGSIPTSWANAGIDDPVSLKRFIKHLQLWVTQGQKDSVAAAIDFPMKNPAVKTSAIFLAKYDTYINNKVKKVLQEQQLNQIFRNYNGAMIGNGELWIAQTKKGFRIVAINH